MGRAGRRGRGVAAGNAADDQLVSNVRAANAWAFYQAKNIRQTMYELAADELQLTLRTLNAEARAAAEKRLQEYKSTIDRYESEPDPEAPGDPLKGEGKKELRAQAQVYEAVRDRAGEQDINFDLAEVALQLALLLGSVAILALNRPTLIASAALGMIGILLTANGFLLLVPLAL